MKISAAAVAACVSAGAVLAGGSAARADGLDELLALASCDDGAVVQLTEDVSYQATADELLVVACDATIDLNGHTLSLHRLVVDSASLTIDDTSPAADGLLSVTSGYFGAAIRVPPGSSLTVRGGTVMAEGAFGGAGIGGDQTEGAGSVFVHGGTVDAQGVAAGIGGGFGGAGGYTEITGGTVTATGPNGAGIGGGVGASGGTVLISGGTVTATGGDGTGIGGGTGGTGGDVTISGGRVIATGTRGAPGIGAGCQAVGGSLTVGPDATVDAIAQGSSSFCGGTRPAVSLDGPAPFLQVDGLLRLVSPTTLEVAVNGGIVVGNTGTITGPEDDPASGSGFNGDGRIDNQGVIAFDEALVEVDVAGHNHLLTFVPSTGMPIPVRVFAPTFTSGYRAAPAPEPGTAWAVQDQNRWWSPDEPLTAGVTLVQVSDTRTLTVTPLAPVTAGTPVEIEAVTRDAFGPVVPQPAVVYSSSNPTDTFTGATIVAAQAGTRTITVTNPNNGTTDTITLTVTAGPAATLQLTPSATSVDQGGSVTFTVSGTDLYGNPVDTTGVVLSSSVATDRIDGLTVTFPTASPHTITAALGAATASVTIEVIPPATTTTSTTTATTSTAVPPPPTTIGPIPTPELPATGRNPAAVTIAAGAALALGALATLTSRRRSTR